MTANRRQFLVGSAAIGAATLLPRCAENNALGAAARAGGRFQHGVASGDPLPDKIVFWTRITPVSGELQPTYELIIARDPELTQVVARVAGTTQASLDFTVKDDVRLPEPGATYYYQYRSVGEVSPVGRTRTAPIGAVEHARFAVCSCSSYGHGYFNVYKQIARRADLDAVIHLGDYIYESFGPDVREHEPNHETISLADYRIRHAQYKTDPDLAECHRQHPFINIWDDHETTDNSYRDSARNHSEGPVDEGGEGSWQQRKAWAIQAYFEWLPVREDVNPLTHPDKHLYRKLAYGDLIDLVMLDTRLLRDAAPADYPVPCEAALADPNRQMLGETQEAWFYEQLNTSGAQWRIVGTSVMIGQWKVWGVPNRVCDGGQYLNADQWDGYQAARQRVMDQLKGVDNVVFLTGDIHSAWAVDICDDPNNPAVYNPVTGDGSLAVEFVVDSITSSFPLDNGDLGFIAQNPHVKYIEADLRGYLVLDVTPERVHGEWWYVDTVAHPSDVEAFGESFASFDGANRMTQVGIPSLPRPAAALAP